MESFADGRATLKAGNDVLGRASQLFTDLVPPRNTGREVPGRLLERAPRVNVLFVSGETDDAALHVFFLTYAVDPPSPNRSGRTTPRPSTERSWTADRATECTFGYPPQEMP